MQFELLNAFTSFLCYINKINIKKLNTLIIIYLNNILIFINKKTYVNFI